MNDSPKRVLRHPTGAARREALFGLASALVAGGVASLWSGCLSQTVIHGALRRAAGRSPGTPPGTRSAGTGDPPGGRGSQLVIPRDAVQLARPSDVVVVRADGEPAAIFLRRLDGDQLFALGGSCTHRGCEVEPRPAGYECPCHGSQFGLRGEVLRGPAILPLPALAVSDEGSALIIQARSTGP